MYYSSWIILGVNRWPTQDKNCFSGYRSKKLKVWVRSRWISLDMFIFRRCGSRSINSPRPSMFLLYSYLIAILRSLKSLSESLNWRRIFCSKWSLSYSFIFALSWFEIMDASAPVVYEKPMTPINIKAEQKILSVVFIGPISPYPTVVTVVVIK